jgi:hypothetical protein
MHYEVLIDTGSSVRSYDGVAYFDRALAEAVCAEARADGTEAYVFEVYPDVDGPELVSGSQAVKGGTSRVSVPATDADDGPLANWGPP